MKAKKTIRRMLAMSPDAWYIFSMAEGGYRLYMTAMSLYETGQALLLIGAIFSVCIEDAQSGRR